VIFVDHVGNIRTHDLPDKHIDWDLDNPPISCKSNLMPCRECNFLLKAYEVICPKCGAQIKDEHFKELEKEMIYIDFELMKVKRKEVQRQWIEENTLEIREDRYKHKYNLSGGVLGEHLIKLQRWFADQIEPQISIKDLNDFFSNQKVRNINFWTGNFTLADIGKNKKEKCMRVYKKWQKSS